MRNLVTSLAVVAAIALMAGSASAAFVGTVDFDDGSQAPLDLVQVIGTSTPCAAQVVAGGFPGAATPQMSRIYDPTSSGFNQNWFVIDGDGDGTGDLYGDVTVTSLYTPGPNYECAVGLRVDPATGYGYGIRSGAGYGTGVSLNYATGGTSGGVNFFWDSDQSQVSTSIGTWYEMSITATGTNLAATIKLLDANWNVVDTASAVMAMAAGEEIMTGLVGTRPAQQSENSYNLDNFTVIPEPATMTLLALGGLAGLIRRRR